MEILGIRANDRSTFKLTHHPGNSLVSVLFSLTFITVAIKPASKRKRKYCDNEIDIFFSFSRF